ncbi:6-phosphogluconate dehydrogenase C-terminal domain-like protein [Dentipellis sp. KUC8613]|nr:6-phosphogluconate dehydrogenase C-terminal domain-like protein [Dentipellis sp. KUC8613]
MSPPLKEILLVGYGAVGSIFSLVLKRSGNTRVTSVARGNFDAVTKHGINFRSDKYGRIDGWRPDRVLPSVAHAADRPYDYVLVTTKAIPEVLRTPDLLSPLLSRKYLEAFPQPTYVFMQNGLNVERDLYHSLKAQNVDPKIISTAVWIGTNMFGSNIVEHNNFDRVSMGVYRHDDFTTASNSESEGSLLNDFGGLLEAGGSTVTIVPEIQRVKFAKNFWNVAFSSIASLTRHPLTAVFRPPTVSNPQMDATLPSVRHFSLITENTIPVLRAIMQELLAVGHALGFPADDRGLPPEIVDRTIESTGRLHAVPESKHRPSMLLDVEKGRPIEVEVILGEVVRMARERGVDIPRIELLYATLLVVQNQLLQANGK